MWYGCGLDIADSKSCKLFIQSIELYCENIPCFTFTFAYLFNVLFNVNVLSTWFHSLCARVNPWPVTDGPGHDIKLLLYITRTKPVLLASNVCKIRLKLCMINYSCALETTGYIRVQEYIASGCYLLVWHAKTVIIILSFVKQTFSLLTNIQIKRVGLLTIER